MRTDLSAFNTAAALQELVCNTLLSSGELSALGIEFIAENRKDIDYEIKKNLTQQGLVGVCMTPTMNYVGHDGASIAYDVKGLTLQVVENVQVNRASNKVSCVTGLDVANYVASYLGGPQAAPGFGIFCPTGIEQGEDNGLIVTKVTFDCTIDGGYGGTFEPISGFHVYNPYVTRDDISSLIQLSIDFNAISAMMSAAISSMVGKADLSTVLSVRDDLRDEIADVSSNLSNYYLKSETSSASEISSEVKNYLPLSGGTVTDGSSLRTTIDPGSILLYNRGLAGSSALSIDNTQVRYGVVIGANYPVEEIADGEYDAFSYLKVNNTGLNVVLSAVQQRAIAEASGHLSNYYLKTETSSASELSTAINPKIDKTEVAQISSSLSTAIDKKATCEEVIAKRASTVLSVQNSDFETLGILTVDVIAAWEPEAQSSHTFAAGDPPMDLQAAGVITSVNVISSNAFYREVGWDNEYRLIGSLVPFTGHDYSAWENLPLFTIQGERGTLYVCYGERSFASTGIYTYGDLFGDTVKLTARETAALKASSAWREVFENYYSKTQTSSAYQLNAAFYARDNKINALSANDSYLSSQLSDAVHYTKDFAGNNTALTIGERTGSSSVGVYSTVNGSACAATGNYSHAAGAKAIANGAYSFAWNGDSTSAYTSHGDGTYNISPLSGLSGFYIGEQNLAYIIDSRTSASQTVDELSAKVNNVSAEVDKLEVELYGGDKNKSVVNAFKLKRLWEQLNAYSSALSLELLSGDLSVQTMVQRTQDIYDIYGISCQPLSSMSALYAAVHDVGTATDLSTTFNLSFKQAFYDLVGDVTSHENTLAQLSVYEASTRNLIPVNVSDLSNDVHYTTWSGVRQYAYKKNETSSAIEISAALQNIDLSSVYKKSETSSASELSNAFSNLDISSALSVALTPISAELSTKVDTLSATAIARNQVEAFHAMLSGLSPLSANCTTNQLLGTINSIIAALKASIIWNS